ncbi:histidine phosphatase family protein [Thioclava nitratireducens]|uniref:histidine phosphatase family protein n=1 Tax=Thioclava nitratireducens TaxID=1915078 RepID=UPI0024806E4F|nr:histidine phosphatase family protein [Thioclava nitratireducens]WGT51421.1 histidine phosphatase family protein [Thioclava nitratireducens]
MPEGAPTELILLRHAPADHGGALAGRRDVGALLPDQGALRALRDRLGTVRVVASPALRCVQSARALWPDLAFATDARLWEQDFGDWEGIPFDQLPDLGAMSGADLARHRPPGGESFADLCARVAPALQEIAWQGGQVAVMAHAGVVRAALALALGQEAPALSFRVDPLSVTRITAFADEAWSIGCVNAGGIG